MLITGMIINDDYFNYIRQRYENKNAKFSENIKDIETLEQLLLYSKPNIIILDNEIEFKNEIVELTRKNCIECKVLYFNGNFDAFFNSLEDTISILELQEKRKVTKKNKYTLFAKSKEVKEITDKDDESLNVEKNKDENKSKPLEKNINYEEDNRKTVYIEKEVIKKVEIEKPVYIEKEVIKEVIKEVEKEVEKEVIKEVIKEVEVPVIIEKEVLKVTSFKSDSVVTFVSAAPTGKSFLSWNIAYALSRNYKVAYINIDSICSANCFFGIEVEKDEKMSLEDIENKTLKGLVSEGYEVNKNLTVYTGRFGIKPYIETSVFFKVLNQLRSENNIVIIDTDSSFNNNLVTALNYSNDVVFIYDLDNAHLKMNIILNKQLEGILNKNNTIAVINNVYEGSNELVNVNKYLNSLDCFKDIITVSNCGKTTYDYIYSNTCNYLKEQNDFTDDLEILISTLKLQGKEKGGSNNKGSLGKKLLNKFRKGK